MKEVKKMSKKQLDRMEEMLANLITMVGNNNHELQNVKEDVHGIKEELQTVKENVHGIKEELQTVKEKQSQAVNILNDMRAEQEHIWEKAVRNEREIAKMRKNLQL